jgi:BirA family biotin operon repressor/biotin-[acetyl-CoA-carboxylase] ligase
VLRPALPAAEAIRLTTAAAVAVCRAVEAEVGVPCAVKWVNDVFVRGKKVCGILTESALAPDGSLAWAVLGIGINVCPPPGGFPPEIADVAGAVCPAPVPGLRARLLCAVERELIPLYAGLAENSHRDEYARRCLAVGRTVRAAAADGTETDVFVRDIDGECRLLVRRPDGTEAALSCGEIRIKL